MSKKLIRPEKVETAERGAFEQAMKDVRPLSGRGTRIVPRHAPGAVASAERPRSDALPPQQSHASLVVRERHGETYLMSASGVSKRILRKLRGGALQPEATLDLHGLNQREALDETQRFIAAAWARGRRCLLIVHGRGLRSGQGGPVLRDALLDALARCSSGRVLAVVNAPPRHGGTGAALVLLRRSRSVPDQT
ncbi:MAG: Smr/MutS family protein [Proteobacteria bacterium]|nr:Smr/MutS family protein [Pseudomonadota bacterium]